eukprot:NODE_100_length_20777_cov_0.240884.p8 type:complete len:287 gc:universal NODE_100_length_20777_cov_0.240884:10363-11223(+)
MSRTETITKEKEELANSKSREGNQNNIRDISITELCFYLDRYDPTIDGWKEYYSLSSHSESYYDTLSWDFAREGTWFKSNGSSLYKKEMSSHKNGSYTKTIIKDEVTISGLVEHQYLIRERWYHHTSYPKIQLREIEAEYPDGDLYHYFALRGTDQEIPQDLQDKYSKDNCYPCRPKIMEYLYRYYQTDYNKIAYQPKKEYFSSPSVLFCDQDDYGIYGTRHPKSSFGKEKPTELQSYIISFRFRGLFPTQFTDPRNRKGILQKDLERKLQEEVKKYENDLLTTFD